MKVDAFLGTPKRPPSLPASTSIDSGATHCFIDAAYDKRLGLKVATTPPPPNIKPADGTTTAMLGATSPLVCSQGELTTVAAFVLCSMPSFPLILDNYRLKAHRALLDCDSLICTPRHSDMTYILYTADSATFHFEQNAAVALPALSYNCGNKLGNNVVCLSTWT